MSESHINEEILDRYALGALPQSEAAAVEEHVLVCEACQARLRHADEFVAVFREVATAPDARPVRHWWHGLSRRAAGLAAAATMAAGVLFVAVERQRTPLAPAVVPLETLRGPESPARVPAGKAVVLSFDVAPEASRKYEARIVDLAGAEVLKASPSEQDGRLTLAVAGLRKGSYWVRVYRAGSSDPLVEYGIEAR
jgi:hypothetical protein